MLSIFKFIKNILCKKNNILQISSSVENNLNETETELKYIENDFELNLKRMANPSINDENGFGIINHIDLKEII